MKDSIHDSLDMIATAGKFKKASLRRVLHTKSSSVMKILNTIPATFEDKAKFDTQNLTTGTFLAQIQSRKTKNEKPIANE